MAIENKHTHLKPLDSFVVRQELKVLVSKILHRNQQPQTHSVHKRAKGLGKKKILENYFWVQKNILTRKWVKIHKCDSQMNLIDLEIPTYTIRYVCMRIYPVSFLICFDKTNFTPSTQNYILISDIYYYGIMSE